MKLSILFVCFIAVFCAYAHYGKQYKIANEKPGNRLVDTAYDETGCLYTSYTNLVMAGYQGWFSAEGDESNRGWYHYKGGHCGGFFPECTNVDFFPDMREYNKTYKTPFAYPDGSKVYLYSSYDEESVDLHFKWMKDYGIDGVHMQRFVGEIKPGNDAGRKHFNKVLSNALRAAKKYGRAISVMYDLSGCTSEDVSYLAEDWQALQHLFNLFSNTEHPTYLRHRGKPLVTIWGVGFNDNRNYSIADVDRLVDQLKGPNNRVSIMLGVPYYWRTLDKDTESNPALHELVKKVDIIMPWAVGRYDMESYKYSLTMLADDIKWCSDNQVDYVPLVFPGFSWGNMHQDSTLYNSIPRYGGDFFWKQVTGAKKAGAHSVYVAMFDEIDEGTAIFKCARADEVPLNGRFKFIGVENELKSDHYLWLTGQAARWFHGEQEFDITQPNR
ncbi:xylosidase [Olivibacter sp. SDN3]|uniref:glycoside hydrolase family 71/99-like protein n=1 Tax=Olivibacter sp. SDN3 TaxID=2764720 RepID=UPI0016517AF2|nr:glycoside hydrolase family 71/99-like protein [Olivibacter sp. SDN3]QNL49916.1 xylosidase [Olivibacter sp. SDN3]